MKIEDHVIKLAARKMSGEFTAKQLQELNDLFEKDATLYEALQLLFSESNDDEQRADDHDRSQLLFEKIKAKINSQS